MATQVVRMALDSQGIPTGDGGRTTPPIWEANGNADYGYCVRNPTNNVSGPAAGGVPGGSLGFFLDSGDLATLSAALGTGVINSVTATLEHMITRPSGGGSTCSVDVLVERPDGLNLTLFGSLLPSDVVSSVATYVTNSTAAKTVDPIGGAAWTMAKLQAVVFFIENYSAGSAQYHADLFYVTVDYTPGVPVPPTEVDVTGAGGVLAGGAGSHTGQGGVLVGGEARTFGIGAGAPPELHLNQWGIEGFTLFPKAEEHA